MTKYKTVDSSETDDKLVYTARKLAKVFMQLGVPKGALNLGYLTESERKEFLRLMDEYEASVRYINKQ